MTLSEIEATVHESIDSGDSETLSFYAEHAAEHLNELGDLLCLAIIKTDHRAWHSIMALASQKSMALYEAMESIEQHCDRSRAAFIEKRARILADEAEHNLQCLAELQSELNRETCP